MLITALSHITFVKGMVMVAVLGDRLKGLLSTWGFI